MALTATVVRDALRGCFARRVVSEVNEALRSQGIPRWGEVMSPHDAALAVLACGVNEGDAALAVRKALVMRDWRCTAPGPGHRANPNNPVSALYDIRLVRVMTGQIVCKAPTGWELSGVEAVGGGLCFNAGGWVDHQGRVPARIMRQWTTVPQPVIGELARSHEPLESHVMVARLMLDRITRTLRAERMAEAAE